MARIKFYTVQFIGANPHDTGAFAPGDRLDFYYDPDLDSTPAAGDPTGIEIVFSNGPVLIGGDLIALGDQSYLQETPLNPLICNGSTAINFVRASMSFPYMVKAIFENHLFCDAGQPACDLQMQGAVLVTDASSSTSNDGQIVINATSSRTIEYKIGDFVYGDGTSQSSGTFLALLPGTYRIYIQDENGCSLNTLVSVGVSNIYGALHMLEYFVTVNGEQVSQTKIEIQQRDYIGSVSEYCAGASPIQLSLRGEGELDKFYPILSTNAGISLQSEQHFQFVHLFQGDRDKYRIVYFKNFGSGYETVWTGKVEPLTYREDYSPTPYEITLTATDGLPELKNKTFSSADGLPFTGVDKKIRIIAQCLHSTGLNLNIRVACNLYAAGMDDGPDDDPLDQAFVDLDRFYILKEAPTLHFVLTHLIKPYGARLIQWHNRWNIVRVEELYGEYDYREFDHNGNYVSNGSFDPVVDRVPPETGIGVWFRDTDQSLEINRGHGKVTLTYDLGLFPSFIRNGNFKLKSTFIPGFDVYTLSINLDDFQIVNNGYTLYTGYEEVENGVALIITGLTDTTGDGFIRSKTYNVKLGSANQIKTNLRFKIPSPYNGIDSFTVPYQKVRFIVTYGDRYLLVDGNWSGKTCLIATTANISLTGEQTIDGVLTSGSRVLVKNQSSPSQNGIYISAAGAWARATDADSSTELNEKVFYVSSGSTNGGLMWKQFTDNPVVGSSSIIFHNTIDLRTCTIYVTEFDKYQDFELTSDQPDGDAVNGYDLNITVYHSYVFHAQYNDVDDLRALDVIDLPQGIRTELLDTGLSAPHHDFLHYYELDETTDAESVPFIVRPNDYHGTTNPYQWVRKARVFVTFYTNFAARFYIDSILIKYLYNGSDPVSYIELDKDAEPNNDSILEETIYFGSLITSISTKPQVGLNIGIFGASLNLALNTQSVLSADIVYGGWIRDVDGIGYENWTRDGFAESKKLHEIYLSMVANQYKTSVKRLSGSFISKDFIGFLHTINETFDDDIKYIPMGMTLNDKQNSFSGEFLELKPSSSAAESPFSSAFTFDFGQSAFD